MKHFVTFIGMLFLAFCVGYVLGGLVTGLIEVIHVVFL